MDMIKLYKISRLWVRFRVRLYESETNNVPTVSTFALEKGLFARSGFIEATRKGRIVAARRASIFAAHIQPRGRASARPVSAGPPRRRW